MKFRKEKNSAISRAQFPSRQSASQMESPTLPRAHWPCPNSDCSNHAQSCRHTFDEGLPFERGFDGSNSWLRGVAAKRRQTHLKIPHDGGASLNGATGAERFMIRIYSCIGFWPPAIMTTTQLEQANRLKT